eukprot:1000878-Pyramimonas_sp.AAC.1
MIGAPGDHTDTASPRPDHRSPTLWELGTHFQPCCPACAASAACSRCLRGQPAGWRHSTTVRSRASGNGTARAASGPRAFP